MGWLGQAQTQRGNVGNYMYIYIYTHTYTYTYTYICVCVYTVYNCVYMYILRTCAYLYQNMLCTIWYACMDTYVCVCIYIHIYIRFVSKFTYIKMQIPTATNTPGPSQLIKSSKIKENWWATMIYIYIYIYIYIFKYAAGDVSWYKSSRNKK